MVHKKYISCFGGAKGRRRREHHCLLILFILFSRTCVTCYWPVMKRSYWAKWTFNLTCYSRSYVLLSSEVYNKEKKPVARKVLINTFSGTKLINLKKGTRRSDISLRSTMVHPWKTTQCPIAKKQHLIKDK